MKKVFCIILSSILFFTQSLYAQMITAEAEYAKKKFDKEKFINFADTDTILDLGLKDCIALALSANSEIKIKRLEPRIAESAIIKAQGVYEPTLTGTLDYEETKTPGVSPTLTGQTVDRSRTRDMNLGITGKTFTNTQYSLNWDSNIYSSNSRLQRYFPDYESSLTGTIIQPLLKDFMGMGTDQGNIVIAKNNKKISDYSLVNEAINVITRVESVYYDYINYIEQYKVSEVSLESAKALLDVVKKRYEKGLASSVELFDAEAGVARREERLLYFEKQLKYAEDELKLVTNLIDDPTLWNAGIRVKDKLVFEIKSVDLVDSIKQAFTSRMDYKMAKMDLKNKDINIKTAANSILPTVDLVGTYISNGLADKYDTALDQAWDGTYSSWSVGLNVTVPFGFSKEISEYNIKKLEKQKAIIAFNRLEQNIILEVRDTTRNVDISYRNFKAAEKALKAEEKTYNAAKERFKEGLVSTKDMLDYQRDLDTENLNFILAITLYKKSLVAYQKSKGTTLTGNNVYVE